MKTRKNNQHLKIHTINGYKVLFVKQDNNQLHVECVIRSGFYNEPKHMSGINHLLEHMMVEGWKKCDLSCIRYWDNKGYHLNASTDKTSMNYYVKGLNHEWKNMVSYIISIINKPILTKKMLEREKQAVIDELLTFSTESDTNIKDLFNKEFFNVDGLKYGDDWKLQIENLKNIKVEDVYDFFTTYFNNNNILFVVLGDFNEDHVYSLFKTKLKPNVHITNSINIDCYTYKHDILFTQKNIENTKILIGFPCKKPYNYVYINLITSILHTIMFNEMRTKKSIIYDIQISNEINLCGTTLYIEFDVQNKHATYAFQTILLFIKKIISMPIINLTGFKNKEIYDYITETKSVMDYYTSLLYLDGPIYSKKQIIQMIKSISHNKVKSMINEILQINNALCVYESKENLHLSWKN
jgi:predicted Zn-dependent peptidase